VRLTIAGGPEPVDYAVMELCSRTDSGDYEAFPLTRVRIDLGLAARRLREAGGCRLRRATGRLALEWEGASVLLFESGRLILEGVVPATRVRAALVVATILQAPPPRHDCDVPDAMPGIPRL
jgi:hypothetical protein